jgi:hypothetical protein
MLVCSALVVAGCGGDSNAGTSAENAAPTVSSNAVAEPDAVAREFLDSLGGADATAGCALLTASFRSELFGPVETACSSKFSDLVQVFGGDAGRLTVTSSAVASSQAGRTTIRLVLEGDPEVSTYDVALFNDGTGWLVSGLQQYDEPGSESTAGADRVAIERWLANWCTLERGQTRQQVVALMGEPTSEEVGASSPIPALNWFDSSADGAYFFTAFLDPDGTVMQLRSDYASMPAAETPNCPATR